jgi:hypothetical protein
MFWFCNELAMNACIWVRRLNWSWAMEFMVDSYRERASDEGWVVDVRELSGDRTDQGVLGKILVSLDGWENGVAEGFESV